MKNMLLITTPSLILKEALHGRALAFTSRNENTLKVVKRKYIILLTMKHLFQV